MNRQSEFFFSIVQFYQTCRIPDETEKILGPKINPPNFQALISPSPEIFPWRIKWYGTLKMESKCLWLVHSSYHLTVWTARPTLRAVPRKTDCHLLMEMPISVVVLLNTLWNSYLNQATKNVYIYLYLPNFPIPKEIPWWKFSEQKRNPFIILITSTHPSPSNPLARPRVKRHCLHCSNQCRRSVLFK